MFFFPKMTFFFNDNSKYIYYSGLGACMIPCLLTNSGFIYAYSLVTLSHLLEPSLFFYDAPLTKRETVLHIPVKSGMPNKYFKKLYLAGT